MNRIIRKLKAWYLKRKFSMSWSELASHLRYEHDKTMKKYEHRFKEPFNE